MKTLLVQDFLITRSFGELREKHAVVAKLGPNNRKISLNYSQLETKDDDRLAQDCRGLILSRPNYEKFLLNDNGLLDEGCIVGNTIIKALPFRRFFNYGQEAAADINWNTARFENKLDGCCHESTIISTEIGNKTIRELCESKYKGKILSFNEDTDSVEFDKVVGHSIQNSNDDWYEITLENGTKVILTGNHKVYLPKLMCYREVRELNGDEEFLIKN